MQVSCRIVGKGRLISAASGSGCDIVVVPRRRCLHLLLLLLLLLILHSYLIILE